MNPNTKTAANMLPKVGLMAIVLLLMLIPLAMVKDQISERESTMDSTILDIEASWGETQCISGPKLKFTYEVQEHDMNGKPLAGKVRTETKEIYPAGLNYSVSAETQSLHRSIYDVTVYGSTVRSSGVFVIPEELQGLASASLLVSLSDLRGIEGEACVTFDGQKYDFVAADEGRAIQATVRMPAKCGEEMELPFDMEFRLKGSEALYFKPVGNLTEVEMTSDCVTPSFVGDFLPTERNVDDSGFSAKWIVSQINRGAPESTEFGVRMLQPVTQYQQTTRSAKYGILIILLVFLAGFIVELTTGKYINILQYLVIGLSLVLFYALLLSFSEIMSFGISYLVAAAMTTLALTGYFRAILRSRTAYLLGGLVAVAYAISYVLLQMETYAFLAGTLVLFVCLLVVMYLTRDSNLLRPSRGQSVAEDDK